MKKKERIEEIPNISADCFIPIGGACRPAYWLREKDLRKESLPFDWMMHFNLNIVIDTFKNGTETWFEKYEEDVTANKGNRVVKDIRTGMVSMHDFPKNISISDALPNVKDKYKRRYNYLKKIMDKSDNICFICNRGESIKELKDFLIKISALYKNKKLKLINIRHNTDQEVIYKYIISKSIIIYDINSNDINEKGGTSSNPNFWHGNEKLWNEICSHLSIGKTTNPPSRLFSISKYGNKKVYRILGLKFAFNNFKKDVLDNQEKILKMLSDIQTRQKKLESEIKELKNK